MLQRTTQKKLSLLFKARFSMSSKLKTAEDFANGSTLNYIEAMHSAWKTDPKSVHISWQTYFNEIQTTNKTTFQLPINLASSARSSSGAQQSLPEDSTVLEPSSDPSASSNVGDYLKVQLLVRAHQVRGHHVADLDPLEIHHKETNDPPKELDYSYYGFREEDLETEFTLGPGILPAFKFKYEKLKLKDIIKHLKRIYCGPIGYEYQHIASKVQCDWLRERIEVAQAHEFDNEEVKMILDRLVWSESFEKFCATKYVSAKRFGLEGCESLIPGMKALIDRSVDLGVKSVVIGMAHRGRLNVLSNVVRKPNESIFSEFGGMLEPSVEGSGDVKYHLGMNYVRPTPSGKRVHLSLVANPSHLEAVNPVVLGKTRAQQFYADDDTEHEKSVALLLHGDASFAAQGVVYETLGFHELPKYTTGGTIHIVINNQVGFTTDPRFARSTPYCTDIAKSISAPIIHVNAEHPESVVFACKLAADWRKTFKRDIVIDIVCYRKYGHNEVDQPSFTQPLMYQIIGKKPSILDKYTAHLTSNNILTKEYIEQNKKRVWNLLEQSYTKSKDYKPTSREWLSSSWNGFKSPAELAVEIVPSYPSGAPIDSLRNVGKVISTFPKEFTIHKVLEKILKAKLKSIDEEQNIDMPTAEALAFGTLLSEGIHVRLSGQDVERGTFSQRHSVLHDQKTEAQYIPLSHISPSQAKFTVCNSSLSEFGTLGFELGYSLVDPNALVIWEAQFGDFANNAQCIIDQFIASGEKKWLQRTGLCVMLPHGYDGQGPEHSSGRLERFLQLCDDHPYEYPNMERQTQDCNMQVVYCSTPANYFHALRRQVKRDFRKPLILFNSKQLLRNPLSRSRFEDMSEGTHFKRIIPEAYPDEIQAPEKIDTHVLCSGQVYYALVQARRENKIDNVAITRIKQLSPFPHDLIHQECDKYQNSKIVWCQEEPLNMGAWNYVSPRILTSLKKSAAFKGKLQIKIDKITHNGQFLTVSSRPPTATVATGNKKEHEQQEQILVSYALLGERLKAKSVKNGIPIFK